MTGSTQAELSRQPEVTSSDGEPTQALCRRLFAGSGLLLMGLTWPLWWRTSTFPQVPLLSVGHLIPRWLDVLSLAVCVAVLISMAVRPLARRGLTGAILLSSLTVLCVVNQHRFQPWVWFLLLGTLASAPAAARSSSLLRLLIASVYLHSGLSKCDYSFVVEQGHYLLDAILSVVGLTSDQWPSGVRRTAVALLPAGEILAAAGLLIPRWRRAGLWLAVAMHTLLLLALGPFGLNHQPAVLVWNVLFVALVIALLRRQIPPPPAQAGRRSTGLVNAGTTAVIAGCGLLPFLEPVGLDTWPSWGLYATHPERMKVFVHTSASERVDAELPGHLMPPLPLQDWQQVRIDRWSLTTCYAPLYPQDRFRLAVVLDLVRRAKLDADLRIVIETRADRWTGHRETEAYRGKLELDALARTFRLNARPRVVE